jgi:hypothetical protein
MQWRLRAASRSTLVAGICMSTTNSAKGAACAFVDRHLGSGSSGNSGEFYTVQRRAACCVGAASLAAPARGWRVSLARRSA